MFDERKTLLLEHRTPAWIFVSHASADLVKVRRIRNFMEDKGESPILFYLRALSRPDQFWPLIELEIAARHFFLFCDSEAARASEWVGRERRAVAAIAQERPIRVGRISLDSPEIDFQEVERFLVHARVYVIHPDDLDVAPVFRLLEGFGYGVLGAIHYPRGLRYLSQGDASEDVNYELARTARSGWLMLFVDQEMATNSSEYCATLPLFPNHRLIFIATDVTVDLARFAQIPGAICIKERGSLEGITRIALRTMLLTD
jgi:TIR domain-containing protein